MHALILGARAPCALEWVRAFHRAGWTVTSADSVSFSMSRASWGANFVRLPEPSADVNRWRDALMGEVTRRSIDVVLPTCEEAFYLSFIQSSLPPSCKAIVMDFQTMADLHHKGKFAKLILGWPVCAPATHIIESEDALLPFVAESNRWVFKPAYSRFAARTLIRPASDLVLRLRPSAADPWVAQEFVAGKEFCSYSIACNGRVTAHACYHPKYKVGLGSGIFFEPVNPPAIVDFVEHFARKTNYSGQVGFDFIESSSGKMNVLECNPRATSGVNLLSNQHEAMVDALLGRSAEVLSPTAGPHMVSLAMLVFQAAKQGWRMEFWRDFFRGRDAVMRWRDPAPGFMQILGLFETVARAVKRRRPLLAAATEDIEWNGGPLGGAR